MKSCPSPWPLLPPHCSTQGWPKCKPCKVAPVLYPTIPQTPPNHLCLLVYTAFAAKASPSFAPAPPHGRQKHLQPSCAKEKSSLVFCNQDKCSLQRQVSRKVTGSKSKRLTSFSRSTHGFVILNLSPFQASSSQKISREMRKEPRHVFSKFYG